MIFRPARDRRGPDPHLPTKMGLLMVGGLIGMTGMLLELNLLVYVAIAILAVGLVLAVQSRRRNRDGDEG